MSSFPRGSLLHRPGLARNRLNQLLTALAALFTAIAVLPLVLVLAYVLFKGGSLISVSLLTQLPPAPGLEGGGIGNAIIGTVVVTLIASLIAVPVGVGGGIYLAEYSRSGPLAQIRTLRHQCSCRSPLDHLRRVRLWPDCEHPPVL